MKLVYDGSDPSFTQARSAANFAVEVFGPQPAPGVTQRGVYRGIMHWF